MKKILLPLAWLAFAILIPATAFAADASAGMLASALTSRAAGPIVGACLVLASWLLQRYRNDQPLKDQLVHALEQIRPKAVLSMTAAGLAFLAGASWLDALTLGLTALLTAAGFTAPAKPAKQ